MDVNCWLLPLLALQHQDLATHTHILTTSREFTMLIGQKNAT